MFMMKRLFPFVLATSCLLFFACGIPVYFVIEPPSSTHSINYEITDDSYKYMQFLARFSASGESSDFLIDGTEIYYRIFNNEEDLTKEISAVNSANTEYTENGFRKIQDKYLRLKGYASNPADATDILIKNLSNSDRTISLRISDSEQYSASVKEGDDSNGTLLWIPARTGTGGSYGSFNFTSSYYPKTGDDDFQDSSSPEDGVWYVNLYAVTFGHDNNYIYQYSQLLHLGSVIISL